MPRDGKKHRIDLSGQVFGRLAALRSVPNKGRRTYWLCRCTCGTECEVQTSKLRNGHTRSCGCLLIDTLRIQKRRHGACVDGRIRREYWSWHNAKRRCSDPNNEKFHRYGARGISMCPEWLNDFGAFFAHMGPCPDRHTLDRIDNDKGYEPGNCRWATASQQAFNRDNKQLWDRIRERKRSSQSLQCSGNDTPRPATPEGVKGPELHQ